MNDLLSSALSLTTFGMGFVFIFLTILVFITKFMSFMVNRNTLTETSESSSENSLIEQSDIDEEAKFVIQQAIKMHTGA
jgi:oxaloacetate decarboxylase gamma subunit